MTWLWRLVDLLGFTLTTTCKDCGHLRGRWVARYCLEPKCPCPTFPAPTVAKQRREER